MTTENNQGDPVKNQDDNKVTMSKEELEATIANKVKTITMGLEDNKNVILAEKKEQQEQLNAAKEKLEAFGNMDPKIIENLLKNEETRLIAEGKGDEVFKTKLDKAKADFDAQVKATKDQVEELEIRSKEKDEKISTMIISEGLTKVAITEGLEDSALSDLLSRAKVVFKIDDTGKTIARDYDGTPKFDKSGNPLDYKGWLNELKETAPHMFKRSQGGGSGGSATRGAGKYSYDNVESMSQEEYKKARKEGKIS